MRSSAAHVAAHVVTHVAYVAHVAAHVVAPKERSFNALKKIFKAPLYDILNSCLDILKSQFA